MGDEGAQDATGQGYKIFDVRTLEGLTPPLVSTHHPFMWLTRERLVVGVREREGGEEWVGRDSEDR